MTVTLKTLVQFNDTDGVPTQGNLITDANGDLFGTDPVGVPYGAGTVFEIVNNGTAAAPSYARTPTTLINFHVTNGESPDGSLIADAKGDLFGTTQIGGTYGFGTVFEIVNNGTAAAPSYASTPTTLVNFTGTDGAFPAASLIIDGQGDLFGTTAAAPSYPSAPTTLASAPACSLIPTVPTR